MPKIQPCRNGCGTQIFVKEDVDGKFKPYAADTEQLHDCPNSEWNKKKQQGEAYRTPKTSSITDVEEKILFYCDAIDRKLILIDGKLDSIISGRSFEEAEPEE